MNTLWGRTLIGLTCVALWTACGSSSGGDGEVADVGAQDSGAQDTGAADTATADTAATDTATEDTATQDTGVADTEPDAPAPPACEGDPLAELPEEIEWVELSGVSDELFTFADQPFNAAAEGDFGTYDLNTMEVYGANGFRFDSPVTVVAAQARWGNAPERGEAPATLQVWPDFGSNGFSFDIDNPITTHTRCVGAADEGQWVTHTFAEPIALDQPLHVFVGYHRGVALTAEGEPEWSGPELMMENHLQEEDPLFSGVRFPDFDDELFFKGLTTAWYTWQVRLGVVRRPLPVPVEERPFVETREAYPALGRVAWGDYDNDGDEDLMGNGSRLFRNDGGGTFTEVTDEAILGGSGSPNGGVWGDYDNDGCLDFFGQGRQDRLLHNNCDGTLTDVTAESGLSDLQSDRDCDGDGMPEPSPTEGSAWADLNGDGFLDLYLANYECSSEFDSYRNYRDRIFMGNGDGTFTPGQEVDSAFHAGRGVTSIDYDRDGDTDLYVSNYRLDPNYHFVNQGDGELIDRSLDLGTKGEEINRAYGHTIGSAWGDIDNDGDFDLINGNLAHPRFNHFSDRTRVLLQRTNGTFRERDLGIVFRETHSNPVLFDADNDGDLDLFITAVYATRDSDFYENNGAGLFALRNFESGLVIQNGWGAAAADVDNDGDLDIGARFLYLNRRDDGGDWLAVQAVGRDGVNASAIGAVIEVEAGGVTRIRSVSGGSGTGCQDSLIQHVGLGEVEVIDRVTVYFPYAEPVTVTELTPNQRVWIASDGEHGEGRPE